MTYILRQELNANCNPSGTVFLHETGVWTLHKSEALKFDTLAEAIERKRKEESDNRYLNLVADIIEPDFSVSSSTEPSVEVPPNTFVNEEEEPTAAIPPIVTEPHALGENNG